MKMKLGVASHSMTVHRSDENETFLQFLDQIFKRGRALKLWESSPRNGIPTDLPSLLSFQVRV